MMEGEKGLGGEERGRDVIWEKNKNKKLKSSETAGQEAKLMWK